MSSADISAAPMRLKQVIVVDASLRLPAGKLAAQVAHAAILAFVQAAPHLQRGWYETGMAKIVLVGESADALHILAEAAAAAGLSAAVVRDAGRTVVTAGTVTCVGIGPGGADEIDRITGTLRLLS